MTGNMTTWRHFRGVTGAPIEAPMDAAALAAKYGSDALLSRQLETGQVSWPERWAWLAKHGQHEVREAEIARFAKRGAAA